MPTLIQIDSTNAEVLGFENRPFGPKMRSSAVDVRKKTVSGIIGEFEDCFC